MRILSIGFPLPNVSVDNYNALTAPSYNDYDGLIIDPATITKSARDLAEEGTDLEAFDGRPILNAPTTASAVSAADQLRRRTDETKRLLDSGGLVVVLAGRMRSRAASSASKGWTATTGYPRPAASRGVLPI